MQKYTRYKYIRETPFKMWILDAERTQKMMHNDIRKFIY